VAPAQAEEASRATRLRRSARPAPPIMPPRPGGTEGGQAPQDSTASAVAPQRTCARSKACWGFLGWVWGGDVWEEAPRCWGLFGQALGVKAGALRLGAVCVALQGSQGGERACPDLVHTA
jgi:hypothetical protein